MNSTIAINNGYYQIETVYTDDNKDTIMVFMQSENRVDLYEYDINNSELGEYSSIIKNINYVIEYEINKNILDNNIYVYGCNNNTFSLYACSDPKNCVLSNELHIKINLTNPDEYIKQCLMVDYVITIIISNGIIDNLFFYSFYISNNNFVYLNNFTVTNNNDFYDMSITSKLATYSLISIKDNLVVFYYCSEFQSEFCIEGEEFLLEQTKIYQIYQTYGFLYSLNQLDDTNKKMSLEITNSFYRGLSNYNYSLLDFNDINYQKNISCSSWFYPSIIACYENGNLIIYQFNGFIEPTGSPSMTPKPKIDMNKYVYQPECFKYYTFYDCVYKCPDYTHEPFMNCNDLKCWSNCMRKQRCYNNAFETFCNEQNEIRLCGANCETLKISEGGINEDFIIIKILILFLFIFFVF